MPAKKRATGRRLLDLVTNSVYRSIDKMSDPMLRALIRHCKTADMDRRCWAASQLSPFVLEVATNELDLRKQNRRIAKKKASQA